MRELVQRRDKSQGQDHRPLQQPNVRRHWAPSFRFFPFLFRPLCPAKSPILLAGTCALLLHVAHANHPRYPRHKEPKLDMAKRVISGELFNESWVELDEEIKRLETGARVGVQREAQEASLDMGFG